MASLPESLPSNVRVIVSSRPNSPLSTDVLETHPLRKSEFIHLLVKSEWAKEAEGAATDELKKVLDLTDVQGRMYGLDMLAFMAASGGWLTARDLSSLTNQHIHHMDNVLNMVLLHVLSERND